MKREQGLGDSLGSSQAHTAPYLQQYLSTWITFLPPSSPPNRESVESARSLVDRSGGGNEEIDGGTGTVEGPVM